MKNALFADDTSPIGDTGNIDGAVRSTKEVMRTWEEKSNEGKEEKLEFATEEGGEKRILGSWLEPKQDLQNRKVRAGAL